MKQIILFISICLISLSAYAQLTPRPKGANLGAYYGYYEYLPEGYQDSTKVSLIIFLHGLGEQGNGSLTALSKLLNNGPLKLAKAGKQFPCVIVAPQQDAGGWFNTQGIKMVLDHAIKTYKIDLSRIYITGLSAGGNGSWIAGSDYADRIAALVPICGSCYPTDKASNMKNLPIWAFHNNGDPTVNISCSINMINAIKSAGGTPKFTIYNSSSHDAWTAAYNDPNLWAWLFAQKKGNIINPPLPSEAIDITLKVQAKLKELNDLLAGAIITK